MSKSEKNYSSSLQSLKGIATLTVYLNHVFLMYGNTQAISRLHESPLHFFYDGQCALVVFFA